MEFLKLGRAFGSLLAHLAHFCLFIKPFLFAMKLSVEILSFTSKFVNFKKKELVASEQGYSGTSAEMYSGLINFYHLSC